MNVATVANWDIRDNGTFFYADHAMKQLAEEQGFECFRLRAPDYGTDHQVANADLYLYVDDGRDDIEWIPPSPWAYWAIDTHLGYGYRLWKARQADRVFVAQRDAVDRMKRDGVENVSWLPLACSPDHHLTREELLAKGRDPDEIEENLDFAFVGFLNDILEDGANNRVDYLDLLFGCFQNSWLSTNVYFDDMCIRFMRARACFNVSIKRDLNMRVFEVLSCGRPLLTNRDVEGIDEFFQEGEHYYGYEGTAELLESAQKLLSDPPEKRREIAMRAHQLVRDRHTYKHRMQSILDAMCQ